MTPTSLSSDTKSIDPRSRAVLGAGGDRAGAPDQTFDALLSDLSDDPAAGQSAATVPSTPPSPSGGPKGQGATTGAPADPTQTILPLGGNIIALLASQISRAPTPMTDASAEQEADHATDPQGSTADAIPAATAPPANTAAPLSLDLMAMLAAPRATQDATGASTTPLPTGMTASTSAPDAILQDRGLGSLNTSTAARPLISDVSVEVHFALPASATIPVASSPSSVDLAGPDTVSDGGAMDAIVSDTPIPAPVDISSGPKGNTPGTASGGVIVTAPAAILGAETIQPAAGDTPSLALAAAAEIPSGTATVVPSAVAPSPVVPSPFAPSPVAPSLVAPSLAAPSLAAPSLIVPSTVAPSLIVPSTVAPSLIAPTPPPASSTSAATSATDAPAAVASPLPALEQAQITAESPMAGAALPDTTTSMTTREGMIAPILAATSRAATSGPVPSAAPQQRMTVVTVSETGVSDSETTIVSAVPSTMAALTSPAPPSPKPAVAAASPAGSMPLAPEIAPTPTKDAVKSDPQPNLFPSTAISTRATQEVAKPDAATGTSQPDATPIAETIQAIAGAVTQLADVASAEAGAAPAAQQMATPTPPTASPARTMTLQLNPADLGTVNVRLHLSGGNTLDVQLSVSDEQTLGIINRERDALSDAINDQTYSLNSLVIQGTDAPAPVSGGNHATTQDNSGSDARPDQRQGSSSQDQTGRGSAQQQNRGASRNMPSRDASPGSDHQLFV